MDEKRILQEFKDGYTVCFLEGCPLSATCAHRVAYGQMRPGRYAANSVLPRVLEMETCPMYVEYKVVRKAWGFKKMYDKVAVNDLPRMKTRIMCYLQGRNSYYRYFRGEKLLTEEQQQWIQEYFKANGYEADDLFDKYVEVYNT